MITSDFLIILAMTVILGAGTFMVLRATSLFRRFALVIAIVATTASTGSLLYARRTVEPEPWLQGTNTLFPEAVDRTCGTQKTTSESPCYRDVTYRGYPFRATKTYLSEENRQMVLRTQPAGRRGNGLFANYIVYVGATLLIGYVVSRRHKR